MSMSIIPTHEFFVPSHKISALVAPVLPGEEWRATVDSIAPHVSEVVVLRANPKEPPGKVDPKVRFIDLTPAEHPHLFLHDVPETWAGTGLRERCTGEHILCDYAAAKQLAWDSMTGDFKLWVEPYDYIENGERLAHVAQKMLDMGVMTVLVNYDFAKDQNGNVAVRLMRERMVRSISKARWTSIVRETLTTQGEPVAECDAINFGRSPGAPERGHMFLKILRRWDFIRRTVAQPSNGHGLARRRVQEGTLIPVHPKVQAEASERPPLTLEEWSEVRMYFYLATDEMIRNYDEEAIEHFRIYAERSTWPQERAIAHVRSGMIHERHERYTEAAEEYTFALIDDPASTESHLGLARASYFRRDWATTIEATKRAYEIGDTKEGRSAIPIHFVVETNPVPLVYLSVAYNEVGRYREAVETCERGLKFAPNDPMLRNNLDYALTQIARTRREESRPS